MTGTLTRRNAIAACLLALMAAMPVASALGQSAEALAARELALRERLSRNQFQRPLVLESTELNGALKGDVYAVVAQPYSVVGPAMQGMDHWCDILIIHLNVKNCTSSGTGASSTLSVAVGRRFDQPIADTYLLDFSYRVINSGPGYLRVQLNADVGPFGTKNYRFVLEAIPLDTGSSFVHMSYSYTYGFAAQLAMQGYLATAGRNKVGFSIVEHQPDGTPVYLGNVRGLIERNAMRYYLAIEAYLGAYQSPSRDQPEKRMRDWFAAVERYPLQLHEIERDEYMSMKRRELARQNAMPAAAN